MPSPATPADLIARALSLAQERFITAAGPGGQNVNKVATAVQLRVNIYDLRLPVPVFHRLKQLAGNRLSANGDIILQARTHRTQEANREAARARLAELITEACTEPKTRRKSRLNRVGKEARLRGKKHRATIKAGRGRVEY